VAGWAGPGPVLTSRRDSATVRARSSLTRRLACSPFCPISCGFMSTLMAAAWRSSAGGKADAQAIPGTPDPAPRPARNQGHGEFPMIAKHLIPGMGTRSFAIMKDNRERGTEAPFGDGCDCICRGRARAFHDGRRPVRRQSWIVAATAGRRDRLALSHWRPAVSRGVLAHDKAGSDGSDLSDCRGYRRLPGAVRSAAGGSYLGEGGLG
jgi:hypothetical protein